MDNRKKRAFITGEQRPNFERNRGTTTILGIFDFGGTGGKADLFQGNKGTGTPGRASYIVIAYDWGGGGGGGPCAHNEVNDRRANFIFTRQS